MPKSDNGNDNIFDAGNSGLESNAASGDAISAGTDGIIEGRIDPALARAASGAGSPPDAGTGGGSDTPGSTGTTSDTGPRRRGRPPGSGNATKEKGEAVGIRASFIEKTLYSIHLGIASIAKAPEFELDKDDAKKLGDAVAGVLKYYKVTMTPKQEAYALLMEAAAQVYPPMIATYWLRKKIEAAEAAEAKKHRPAPQVIKTVPDAAAPLAMRTTVFDPKNIDIPQ